MTLTLTDITTTYEDFTLGPLSLVVDNEVLAVLGPSGSGKTTILSSVAGIVQPDTGSMYLNERSLIDCPIEHRDIGVVFQDGALFPHMTAYENIAYAATTPEHIDKYTTLLDIAQILDRKPAALSGGERQRVALARTLAADPSALLLDEPLSSLDTPIRRRLRGDLRALFQTLDIPVIYVTHDQQTATALGDRLAIVQAGMIKQIGTPQMIRNAPNSAFVARFTGNENLFTATVTDHNEHGAIIRIGEQTVQTTVTWTGGDCVTASIHPARIQVGSQSMSDLTDPSHSFTGTVVQQLTEGSMTRVTIAVQTADIVLIATVHPPMTDQLSLIPDETVEITFSSTAVHLFARE